jgi:hypothetical protein
MSTGLECNFVEVEPNKWYYLLQQSNCPVQCWDWREHADCYGPFTTFDLAQRHLDDNHANPGGYSREPYSPERKLDGVMQRLIAAAIPATPRGNTRLNDGMRGLGGFYRAGRW